MPSITYVQPDGRSTTLDVDDGVTVMKAAVAGGVAGIVAECGGSLMCATCHVYVDDAFAAKAPVAGDDEDEMLDVAAAERRTTSRLSCQIKSSPELDGLVVHVPDSQ
jgi:2Fe-2S ferredoxin